MTKIKQESVGNVLLFDSYLFLLLIPLNLVIFDRNCYS